MSWKVALVVALLTAVITAIITAPVTDKVTRMHGVSDFEGGRGMLIGFVLIPAGFIGGFLFGLLGTKLVHAVEWNQFWKAAGLSVVMGQAALFGIAGLSVLTLPRPPLINGQQLSLEIEVRVPRSRITPDAKEPNGIRLSIYAGPKDNHYADIDRSRFREEGDDLIVTAIAPLRSRSYGRVASFHILNDTWLAADITLPARPSEADTSWTSFAPMRDARTAGSDAVLTDVSIRYKVVAAPSTE
ncbi:MAG TPA: hypothetical protein PLL57_04915 [Flavobacteriales bacterium]|nr:hypothetical protein [Flavobacteriales bacterium]